MDQQHQVKTNLTDSLYQSQFLPMVEHANMTIKKLVVYFAIHNKNQYELKLRIKDIINELDKRLPIDLKDRQSYLLGLEKSADILISKTYRPILRNFAFLTGILYAKNLINKKLNTPLELIKYTDKLKPNKLKEINNVIKETVQPQGMWETAKGTPHIENYAKQVKDRLNGMAKTDIAPITEGKKPITIWQKAELDIRHDHQMAMVDDLREQGNVYCWISSHPDCSKRCAKWQGKLVDIVHHAELPNFKMRNKLDGHTVYSLTDIMAQTDKYGYQNNIINGFNCRHHLVPYTHGSHAPIQYNADEIKKEREINSNLRKMEREIRHLKQKANLYAMIDTKEAKRIKKVAMQLESRYKAYAESNGFAWYQYRIQA